MSKQLDNLAAYFNEKERKKLDNLTKETSNGLPEMTLAEIRLSCLENDGYETPELNEKLYLHFRGFRKIENLESYTGCKAIWLDSNGFDKIQGLDALVNLRCVYLAKNLISRIEGLSNLQFLTTLDLSNNRITVIENLSCCPALQSLNISKNALSQLENIQHLTHCQALQTIDIMDNQLDGDILPTLQNIPSLLSIALNGNPTTRMQSFRKRIIAALPKLCYLDRPVEEHERLGAIAFMEGGAEAERLAKDAWRAAQAQKRKDEMESFRVWQKERREKAAAEIAAGTYSGIREFTEEEKAQRRAEAEEAAADEKLMIEGGVSKIAKKYWALEGQRGQDGYNFDALNEAVVQMRREAAGLGPDLADAEDINSNTNELLIDHDDEDDDEKAESSPGTSDTQSSLSPVKPPNVPDTLEPSADAEEPLTEKPSYKDFIVENHENLDESTCEDGDDENTSYSKPEEIDAAPLRDAEFAGLSENEIQNILDRRVADSMKIYMRQREIEKAKKNGTYVPPEPSQSSINEPAPLAYPPSSTWAAARVAPPVISEAERPLYWTETMDIHLANLVRRHVFDFEKVSAEMRGLAEGNVLGLTVSASSFKITVDACRLRWTQLDAKQWAEVGEETPSAPVYKVHVQVDVLGKGHGAQPSFQSMASMAAGSMPSYLSPPTQFPSVSDAASDDEEEQSRKALDGLD